jgi:hypothetical protein
MNTSIPVDKSYKFQTIVGTIVALSSLKIWIERNSPEALFIAYQNGTASSDFFNLHNIYSFAITVIGSCGLAFAIKGLTRWIKSEEKKSEDK